MGLILGGLSPQGLIMDGQSVSLYVGGNPPTKVWPTRETVQIILGTDLEARDQLRAALADRGLDYKTVTEIPFDIELVGTGSARDMFRGCAALTTAPAMDTSGVTNMRSMFNACNALTTVPDMDTSRVTNMGWMFQDCPSLTTAPAMDTSNVTHMNSMFRACASLTSVPNLGTSGVTDTSYMFYGCAALTDGDVLLIGKHPQVNTTAMIQGSGLTREPFDTVQIALSTVGGNFDARNQLRAALTARGLNYSTVTKIPFEIELVGTGSTEQLFQDCYALTTVPEMDTSRVTNMKDMFSQCRALTHVPDMDTSQVTNMRGVFYNCQALTYVPWMDMSQAVDSPYMFANCLSLTYVPDMDTSQVTGMRSMFSGCSSLTHAPALDTSQVVDSAFMFDGCTSLVYVPDMYVSKNVDFYAMFRNCSSLTDGNVRLIGYKSGNTLQMITGSGLTKEPFIEMVQITLGSQAQMALRDVLSARGLSYRTVTELPFGIELVGTGSAGSLFDGFAALKSVPAMNTSQVTNMERMFAGCKALTTVPAMDTSQVTSMYYMFYDCSALTSVPVMNTSQVTNVMYMFRGCSSLTDENVRLIGKNPNVDNSFMIDRSGLTKEPFYATDRLPNPPAPRVVTISKHSTNYGQWDTNSATGDVSLIQEWAGSNGVRFAAYVTCNETVYSSDSYQMQDPGAVLRSGAGITPYTRSVYTFTEVI